MIRLPGRLAPSPGRRGRTAWIALAGFAAFAASCSRSHSPALPPGSSTAPPPQERSSLLLVTLDTFRGDSFGAGGDSRSRTPHLDRLARQGVQFELGVAGSPLTLPSHANLFTGLDAPEHGILDNGLFRLDERIATIASALQERGLRTGATIGAFPLDARFGLGRGFESYDDEVGPAGGPSGLRMAQRDGADVAQRFTRWLHSIDENARWFGWAHFYDPHQPHDAPAPLVHAAGDDVYRAELAETDAHLGRLVREASSRATPPWIFVVADHGESRGEHQEATHGIFVYDATLRIPAVLWPAPSAGPRGLRRAMFRPIDFPATAFGLLGFDPRQAPGRGADALDRPAPIAYFDSHAPRLHFGWASLSGVRTAQWKFIEAPEPELYDLANDPGELRNLFGARPDVADSLETRLREVLARRTESIELDPSAEERAALESLGYVMTRPSETSDSDGGLPDPKRRIGLHRVIETAQELLSMGRAREALAPLRAALAQDPNNKEVQLLIGLAFAADSRHLEAIDAFLRCLSLPPRVSDRIPRFELASCYLRLRRPAQARRELEKIIAEDSTDASTWYNLGVAREMEGDLSSARRAWESAVRADPTYELARRELERIGTSRRD